MNIELRLEQPEDHRKTEEIMREAFWNYYAPGCYEHYLLHIMRNSPSFVKELDFVAVWENKIIGSVVCLKSFIAADNGNKYEVLSMGPIAVLPKYQRMGVGKALIAHTRSVAAEWGIVPFCCAGIPIIIQKQDLWQQSNSISVPPKTNILQLSMCALYGRMP